ncbi:MAG: hypothetical protein LBP38_03645, partial [Desulfovibrio sp.]|nr:hypothetical protein [Desulfovibrio sp.]
NISKLQVFPSCAEVLRNILATCWFYNIFAPKIYPLMYTLELTLRLWQAFTAPPFFEKMQTVALSIYK